jgi:protein-disulfide isomerase
MTDLASPVSERDHRRGEDDAPVVLVNYCDFACPDCIDQYKKIRNLLQAYGDKVLYVYRSFPLVDIYPAALNAARYAEAAGKQGHFWTFHDFVFANPDLLEHPHQLLEEVRGLGLDIEWLRRDVADKADDARIQEDIASGKASGVTATPTLFLNGRRLPADGSQGDLVREAEGILQQSGINT